MKKIITYIFMVVAALLLVFLIGKALPFSNYTNNFISRTVVSLLLVFILIKRDNLSVFFLNKKFLKGLYLGKWLILIIIANALSALKVFDSINFTAGTIFLLLASNFMIAFFEEVLTRGIIFNQLLKEYSVTKAALLSSVIFGVVHLINLTHNPDFVGVLTQVIYTFFIGVLFAAVYYATKNLWSAIFLHFILDLSSGLQEIASPEKVAHVTQTNVISALLILVLVFPAYYSGRKILTKYASEKPLY
ncbi:CPBP family intramembrane glutamic endopeptidase [Staphylococcus aureus]|uniref:CPBP family intramembrane glutamic endopeptidase n=1 Tax=Staphylococcus aureus TaxID=1280 RepID=UPI002175CE3C|nr:CPBP family intramembrane glutamic endopeptidase [Staphylococcus aureus]MCS5192887.1 CPBP family intramembrane metalloprotease [Staphylococcus aureus]